VRRARFIATATALTVATVTMQAVAPAQAASSRSLFAIPVEQAADVRGHGGRPLHIALAAADPVALQRALGAGVVRVSPDGRVETELGAYQAAPAVAGRTWLEATFLIDFNDAPVPDLVAELRALTPRPQRADVVAFVAGTVRGSHERAFDLASQVARKRTGDCTEFAVLTAALARAVGLPARVVLGLAVVTIDGRVKAYGHAWAEIASGDDWHVADAALLAAPGDIRYLPLGVLDDEGPGYAMGVARLMPGWVRQVVVLDPEHATP
jgi:transglutaminase-like putative cysteine protease